MAALPAAASAVARLVTDRLRDLLGAERERWGAVDPELPMPFDRLAEFVLAGGKRLRPAFCYWSFIGAGGAPDDPVIVDAGAALELLHAAALVHDDVIDGSTRRHGSDAVHVQYTNDHVNRRYRGDSRRFGEGAAIILGDLALAYSERLMSAAPTAAVEVFDEMRLEVNVGQYLDILGSAQGLLAAQAAVARARRICRYKTAKYTVERPLHLGAALAGPDRFADLAEPLSAFGLPLGEAFQLRDDLLGLFGDPALTGKPVGDDLREGKPTLLASLAAATATGEDREFLADRFGAADLSDAEISRMIGVVEASGARAQVEQEMTALVDSAMAALSDLPVRPEAREALGELASFVAGRDH